MNTIYMMHSFFNVSQKTIFVAVRSIGPKDNNLGKLIQMYLDQKYLSNANFHLHLEFVLTS